MTKYCKKCGDEKELIKGKLHCAHCKWLYDQEYYENNKEKIMTKNKLYYESNRSHHNAYMREYGLKYKHNLSIEDYNQMLENQNGICAICLKYEIMTKTNGDIKQLCVDHDHISGKIRGLLCDKCNKALGLFGDDLYTLIAAVKYLERWSK